LFLPCFTVFTPMALTDDQIFVHLDRLVLCMLSPVMLDQSVLYFMMDEDEDDDG